MDPITHVVSGALASQAVRETFPGKALVPCAIVAAWIPDVDIFFTRDPEVYLQAHRGITHSLAGGIFVALAVALGFWLVKRKEWPFGRLFAFSYCCVLLHIFLDWANSYGTMIFSPFSAYRAMLGSVFIIDPFLTLGIVAFLVTALLRRRGQKTARFGIMALLVYPFFNAGIQSAVEANVRGETDAGDSILSATATPDFLTPWHWKVIFEYEDGFGIAPWTPDSGLVPETTQRFRKPDAEALEDLVRQESFVETWLWFAGYPVVWELSEEQPRILTLADLRFYSTHPLWRDRQPSPPPFSLQLIVGADGTLLDWHYDKPGAFERPD